MVGRAIVGSGGARASAAWSLIFTLLAAFTAACTSDATSICERLNECGLLPEPTKKGDTFNVADCESDVNRELSDEKRADCAACVERKPCRSIVTECKSLCAPP